MTEVIEREATAPSVKSDTPAVSPQSPRLLDQMRERIRVKHYSLSTRRLGEHTKSKEFDSYLVLPCKKEEVSEIESYFIKKFNPPLNEAR